MEKNLSAIIILILSGSVFGKDIYLECTHRPEGNTESALKNVQINKVNHLFNDYDGKYHFSTIASMTRLEATPLYYIAVDDDHEIMGSNVTYVTIVQINRLTSEGTFLYNWNHETYSEVGKCKRYTPKI